MLFRSNATNYGYIQHTGTNLAVTNVQAGNIDLYTSNLLRATLDSSGNLGLGVTPSAWSSSIKASQVGATSYGSVVDLGNGVTSFGSNFYNDGGNKYIKASSAYPVQYLQDTTNGNHTWRIASAGTAGNAISFTQAMTLDEIERAHV